MMTSPYVWEILEWDEKQQKTNKQNKHGSGKKFKLGLHTGLLSQV